MWNAIELPAAMLQAPSFDLCADPAVNYGAIGSIIAHEMAHAFDDQGSRFDSQGVLREWWSPQRRQRYTDATRVLREQYSRFEPLPGMRWPGSAEASSLAPISAATVASPENRTRSEVARRAPAHA